MKIDFVRILLLAALAMLCVLLLNEWVIFKQQPDSTPQLPEPTAEIPADISSLSSSPGSELDELPQAPVKQRQPLSSIADSQADSDSPPVSANNTIKVFTDVLQLEIDLHGGDIINLSLPTYPAAIDKPEDPFQLLLQQPHRQYISRSGLISQNGASSAALKPLFSAPQSVYRLEEGSDQLVVELSATDNERDLEIIKRFRFERKDHLIDISYEILNRSDRKWQGNFYGQLRRTDFPDPQSEGVTFNPSSYLGFACFTEESPYTKIHFSDLADGEKFESEIIGGWVSLVQHYFITAWIPQADEPQRYRLAKSNDRIYNLASFVGPKKIIAPGESGLLQAAFYAGPKDQDRLGQIADGLPLTVDYGWLWWLSQPLFQLLRFLHQLLGNWGAAIIVLTFLVKLLFFPLSNIGYRSIAKIRAVQPKINALRERLSEDRQKMSQEMMALYRKEKINPLGGCLPILVQMPVFLALYWVLLESVELRQAPFMLWIRDLSVLDPWFVLPVLMGVSMFFQQKMNPQPPDPMQAKIMMWMPVVLTVLFLFFPAGLVLYWLINNVLSILQQWAVTRRYR